MGKHSKKHKHHKKSKKQSSSSSSSDEWVEAELLEKKKKSQSAKRRHKRNSSESSSDEIIEKRRRKKRSKSTSSVSSFSSEDHRKERKSKSKSKRRSSSGSRGSSREDESRKNKHAFYEKTHEENSIKTYSYRKDDQNEVEREEWMNLSTVFSSYSNEDRKKDKELEKKKQKEAEQYNPRTCTRELNPYWKDGGDGLPKFQKPKDDSDDDSYRNTKKNSYPVKSTSGWKKSKPDSRPISPTRTKSSTAISEENKPSSSRKSTEPPVEETTTDTVMTEKELNLLAGKLVKAEIMGNDKLVKELKEKLENGRKALEEAKAGGDEVLLTQTDRLGHVKPLTLQSDCEEGPSRRRKKVVETHKDKQRVKYFADDDKYSLKQLFENEKYSTSNDQDRDFMKMAANVRKNDDLDDLFTDNVRRKKSDSKTDEAIRSKAISEHIKVTQSLDNCPKCIQSEAMHKHLIVSTGEYVYLSLPAHEPLLDGHCLIVPIRHVQSVTHLDENEWAEIMDIRKALVRMFASKVEEPIFFEIATGFHRYPHMVLECVPMPKEDGDMAPIYFKKAIDESETDWAQNKKLVSLKGRDVRRAIPKGLPYFSVSFGMDEGFAHVIEDEKLFPSNFAQEIIGGMLDLHHSKWRKPVRQKFDVQSKRVLNFSNEWKEFDCTSKK